MADDEVVEETPAEGEAPATPDASTVLREEMNAKFSTVERAQSEMLQILQAMRQAPAATPVRQDQEYSDDDLWSLQQQGSKQAADMLLERKLKREREGERAAQARVASIQSQVKKMYESYPFSKSEHPLTRAAVAIKNRLMGNGWANDIATDLEAMKLTLVDHSDLVADYHASTPRVRTTSTPVMGNMPRRTTPKDAPPTVSEKEKVIAKRMGVKDPAKAIVNFQKNQDSKRSTVSPMIAVLMREES